MREKSYSIYGFREKAIIHCQLYRYWSLGWSCCWVSFLDSVEVDKGAVVIDHLVVINGLVRCDCNRDVGVVLSSVRAWQFLEKIITISGCHMIVSIDWLKSPTRWLSLIKLGRLIVIERLQSTNMFLSWRCTSKIPICLVGLNLSMTHLKAIKRLIHLHFICRSVANLRLAWASRASVDCHSLRILLLLANILNGWVKVLPKWLYSGHVFPFMHFFLVFASNFLLVINVSGEFLFVQVVH